MIKDHPMVGIGMNTVYESRSNYMPSFFTDDDWLYIAHNQFLHVTAEAGVVGLAAFVWLLWVSLRAAASARRSKDSQIYEAATALFVAQIAMLWGMNLDFY